MKIRVINRDNDYEMLCDWWQSHGWGKPVPKEALPPIGVLVLSDDDIPLTAGFLYNCDGTSFGFIGFVVSNPLVESSRKIYKSIIVLLGELKELAFRVGCTTLCASLGHTGLIKAYERVGFVQGDKNVTNMIFNLGVYYA